MSTENENIDEKIKTLEETAAMFKRDHNDMVNRIKYKKHMRNCVIATVCSLGLFAPVTVPLAIHFSHKRYGR